MITGIVVALPEELRSLTAKKITKGSYLKLNDALLLGCAGAGPANAQQAATQLVAQGATRLISWGCAAGLAPQLKAGELVLATAVQAANGETLVTNPSWCELAQTTLAEHVPIRQGLLLESTVLVATASAKQALQQSTQALALDMESAAVARIAQQHNLPFLVIRAIADPADMDLPVAVVQALNAQGEVQLPKLLGYLLTHLHELPGLITLGLHFKAALNTLKTVNKHLSTLTDCFPA